MSVKYCQFCHLENHTLQYNINHILRISGKNINKCEFDIYFSLFVFLLDNGPSNETEIQLQSVRLHKSSGKIVC